MTETPKANRIHIAFFGLRNAGKSTLVNEFCRQEVAIVSDTPGTTTDPVSKAMEILPLGPCLITDTAGLDDEGNLGELRVKKSLGVLATTDVAVWVEGEGESEYGEQRKRFRDECEQRKISVIEFKRGDSVDDLRRKVAAVKVEQDPGLLDGLVKAGDRVVCICPIDESAPKGRLILPQVQVIRECLDRHAVCTVAQPGDVLKDEYDLAITDSQAFAVVKGRFHRLTSFSVLFARQKGKLETFVKGLEAIAALKDGDTVMIAEGCTHHRQCNDIGAVKIPKALEKLSGKKLDFVFASGSDFGFGKPVSLVVHCGGCMLTRREMLRRIALAEEAGVPIVNYGLLLATAGGINVKEIMP